MGRKPNWPPKLVRKPDTAEARTYYAGRWWTCGRWDEQAGEATPAARAEHARLIARWVTDPGSAVRPKGECLLSTLLTDWSESAERPESAKLRQRLRRVVGLLGPLLATPAAEFTPAALTAWRKGVGDGRSRVTVAAYTVLVLRAYQWAEDAGRVTEGVAGRLWAVVRRRGVPTPGRASRHRPPADERAVTKVGVWLRKYCPDAAALFALHAVTGARVTELLVLAADDVRRSGTLRTTRGAVLDLGKEKVWAADLGERHKTAREGKERVLVFGPRARKVLAPLLRQEGLLFPGRTPQGHRRAVKAACRALKLPHFYPRQLRQTVADRVQKVLTAEHVAAYLGHTSGGKSTATAERRYLTLALGKAAEAARKVG